MEIGSWNEATLNLITSQLQFIKCAVLRPEYQGMFTPQTNKNEILYVIWFTERKATANISDDFCVCVTFHPIFISLCVVMNLALISGLITYFTHLLSSAQFSLHT